MRLIPATVFMFFLTACQTLGIDQDPDAQAKRLILATSFVADGVGVYGHLCAPVKTNACRSEKAYQDAKLILGALVEDAAAVSEGRMTPVVALATFGFVQWQLIKTVHGTPAPTDPNSPPLPDSYAYIQAIGAADMLVNTYDERVQDALAVNTSPQELLAGLRAKVAALP